MPYSKEVIQHFKNPHNQGKIKNADAVGKVGNPVCGDILKIYLKIKPTPNPSPRKKRDRQEGNLGAAVIKDIKFETLGCAVAIAVSSVLTDRAKGKTLDEALKIKKDDIVKDLGGLPRIKIHCSMLGIKALRKAIGNFRSEK